MILPLAFPLMLLARPASATASFDPSTPAAAFTGQETYDQAGELKLWSRVERLEDPDRSLFRQEQFNDATAWPEEADWAPWIETCFGTPTPHSSAALLHMGLNESVASGTPILLVPGAGDNGVRAFVTMATRLDQGLRPVYALTFAHPHGDVFQQAEAVADAIARIRARTGAAQVDVVAHSKGGAAVAVYISNDGSAWGQDAYDSVGTTYRHDVRRAVFIATPLGGIDTSFRWPGANLASLDADTALSPTSWTTWYPYTTALPTVSDSLLDQYIGGGGADYFPGHRQLLAAWDGVYALPGDQAWLGVYALQPDWMTTYYGGMGYQSYSEGIDSAIDAGGDLIAALHDRGADPDVEIYLLAGENPLMPNGTEDWLTGTFDAAWLDLLGGALDSWSELVAAGIGNGLEDLGVTEGEVQGLASGDLILGDISGPSDGLVFVESALDGTALTTRGATVVESRTVNLSHIDMLYASDITGQMLIDSAGDDPSLAWMAALGARYIKANTLAWVETVLADDVSGDTGSTGSTGSTGTGSGDTGSGDTGSTGTGSTGTGSGDTGLPAAQLPAPGGCGRCSGVPAGSVPAWALGLVGLVALRRRGRDPSQAVIGRQAASTSGTA
ncbi:MAG: hypothetical protein GXP62_18975 [Oligoflexia bacterium]|nr:hypothetical protein [Oligoflexia bacterium]